MEDRLARIESQLQALRRQCADLERRLAALETRAPAAGAPAAEAAAATTAVPDLAATARAFDAGAALTLIGRTLVVLAGAYLLRALTDSDALAPRVGVGAGIAYALTWIVMADRAGAGGRRGSAAFHGLAFVLIGLPLLLEATLRFKFLSHETSAGALTAFAAISLGVAWRQKLRGLAWITTLGAIFIAVMLMTLTGRVGPYAISLVLLGVTTLWFGYVLDWIALRWPVALVTDLTVFVLTLRGVSARSLDSAAMALFVQVLLLALYLGSFAARTLFRNRDIIPFEIVQSVAALIVGLGGAAFVTRWTGVGARPLGLATFALGLGAYAVAIAFVERRQRRRRNFHFYAAVAFVFTMTGSGLMLSRPAASLAWAGLALGAVVAALRLQSLTLRSHGATYAVAAAVASGLLAHVAHGLGLPLAPPWPPVSAAMLAVLAAVIAGAWLLVSSGPGPYPRAYSRIPGLLLLVLSVGGGMGVTLAWVAPALAGAPGTAEAAGIVATLRTAVLVVAALALAWAARSPRGVEGGWLVYPLLVVTGVKFLFEDFRVSRPATLFAAFALYGVALILAPRLRKR